MIHMNSNLQTLAAGVHVCIKLQRRVSVFVLRKMLLKKKHPWFWNNHRSDLCRLSWTVRYISLENVAVFAVLLLHTAALLLLDLLKMWT